MLQKTLFFLLLLALFNACSHFFQQGLIVESFEQTNKIPSASGVAVVGDEIWMVGDDSPFLYRLDKDLDINDKFRLSNIQMESKNRVLKTNKADFESITKVGDSLFILGSGSKIHSRDTLVIFDVNEKKVVSKHNMRHLFQQFLNLGSFDSIQQINIEGFAQTSSNIYFLNRGNVCGHNDIYIVPKDQFYLYLKNQDSINLEMKRFQLPKIKEYLSGFSGACLSEDGSHLFFTSSVEATTDVYHDGEVLGSFVGMINLETDVLQYWPLEEEYKFMKTKLESISIIDQNKSFIKFICTSDNDDGTSGIYHLRLTLKPE